MDFWTAVEERLAAGHMRLLLVADRIPLELQAIVDFLNRQMRQTDVYAVEPAYRGSVCLQVTVRYEQLAEVDAGSVCAQSWNQASM
ncbi:hypothetical protein ACFQVC_11030 [Streptomyces monticola]|uniref:Uncharacterized protein n=1 Tax=Streptomyces monticola TaxID=2666263 RepID=A0ABW2JH65_9ACTN